MSGSNEPHTDPRTAAEEDARERILALPPFTLMRLGWETGPGRVQGSVFYRIGDGLGPTGRDSTPVSVLRREVQRVHMPHADQKWGIQVLASPVASDVVRLTEQNQQLTAGLLHYWRYQSCPCGARRESPRTHHHVIGCPVGLALNAIDDSAQRAKEDA